MSAPAAWKSKATLCQQATRSQISHASIPQATRTVVQVEHSARLTLFGDIRLQIGGREIALNCRKAKALLAYLSLTPGMKETRSRLVGLLWSESDETRARASLRQLLHTVRETFDHEGVVGFSADKLQVGLDGSITTDLDHALASIHRGNPLECLVNEMHISETLLAGYDDIDPAFTHWVGVLRETVRQRLVRALEAQLCEMSHPIMQIKHIARALFQVDPTHELACQKLMRAHVETGDVAGALVAYKRLWMQLEQDHDIEPSSDTQELVVAIKCGTYRPAAPNRAVSDVTAISASVRERKLSTVPAM